MSEREQRVARFEAAARDVMGALGAFGREVLSELADVAEHTPASGPPRDRTRAEVIAEDEAGRLFRVGARLSTIDELIRAPLGTVLASDPDGTTLALRVRDDRWETTGRPDSLDGSESLMEQFPGIDAWTVLRVGRR